MCVRGFPGGPVVKDSACQRRSYKRSGFNPWARMIPWRRKRQPTPVSCLDRKEPGGLQSMGTQTVRPVLLAFPLLLKKNLVNISSFCPSPHSLPFWGLTREIWLISAKRTRKVQVRISNGKWLNRTKPKSSKQ